MDNDAVPFGFRKVEGCAETYLEVTVDGSAVWTMFFFVAHPAKEGCGFGEVYGYFGKGASKAESIEVFEFGLGLLLGYLHLGLVYLHSTCTCWMDFALFFLLWRFLAAWAAADKFS